jgi:large conductance mechanosensitive channel
VLKGFKDFLMRGNVVDLAVAVIIGTAFTAIVTAIADSFIKPLIAAIGGAKVTGLSWQIVSGNADARVDFAAVISAAINFLIVAAVVYFLIVLPMKKIQERRKRGEEAGPTEPTDVELLTEIRDLLRQQAEAPHQQAAYSQAPQQQAPHPQTAQQQAGQQVAPQQQAPQQQGYQQTQQLRQPPRPQQPPPPQQPPNRPY